MLNPSRVGIFIPIPAGFKFQELLPDPLVIVNSNLFHPGSVKVIVAVCGHVVKLPALSKTTLFSPSLPLHLKLAALSAPYSTV